MPPSLERIICSSFNSFAVCSFFPRELSADSVQGMELGFSKTLHPAGPGLVRRRSWGCSRGHFWFGMPAPGQQGGGWYHGQARQEAGLWVKSCLFSEFVGNQGTS